MRRVGNVRRVFYAIERFIFTAVGLSALFVLGLLLGNAIANR